MPHFSKWKDQHQFQMEIIGIAVFRIVILITVQSRLWTLVYLKETSILRRKNFQTPNIQFKIEPM